MVYLLPLGTLFPFHCHFPFLFFFLTNPFTQCTIAFLLTTTAKLLVYTDRLPALISGEIKGDAITN
jgi:hypothetical protein